MPVRDWPVAFAPLAAAALLLAACQSASPPPAPVRSQNFLNAPADPDAIVDTAPAAMRLQDIGGYILLYYREHQAMPPSLDELRKIPGGGDLNFTSPSSGQPFAFSPAGMWIPNQGEKCIIAYDPARTPNGNRWCLFMMLPKNGAALSVDVVTLPEPMFLSYRPIAQ